jgi:transposase InsO family protein
VRLLRPIARAFRAAGGAPKHMVSDRGRRFDCRAFRRWCRRRAVKWRYGAVGKRGSIAVIERLIRTISRARGRGNEAVPRAAQAEGVPGRSRLLRAVVQGREARLKPHGTQGPHARRGVLRPRPGERVPALRASGEVPPRRLARACLASCLTVVRQPGRPRRRSRGDEARGSRSASRTCRSS